MTSPPAVAFDRVRKVYARRGEPAVADVSLDVGEGEFLAIVGPSGSGKTTLMKTVNRLVEPDAGEVRVFGRRNDQGPAWALRRRVGYVFQNLGLFPHLSVGENIAVTPRLAGWPARRIAARVDELLDLVALPRTYALRRPSELSGGERQRVGVARALAARPSLMLMDEPFGALDPVTRDALGRRYRELHEMLGLTTLMVTHDVQEAALLADRVVVMQAGRVAADDTPRALLAGHADPAVAALVDTPRRQAEAIQALLAGEAPGHG